MIKKLRYLLFSFCILFLFPSHGFSNSIEEIIDDAKSAYDNEDYSEVVKILSELDDKNDEAYNYLARSFYYLEQYDEAIKNFLNCSPDYLDCKTGLARVYYWISDYEKAVSILEPLIDSLDPKALFTLGYSYDEIKLHEKALSAFLVCANKSDEDDAYIGYCQNNVGHMYHSAIGTELNFALAFHWYTKAYEREIGPWPTTSLAAMYLDGEHVNQSYAKAFELYHEAAAEEFDRANYALGLMYEKGEGTPFNYQKAKEYYKIAFDQGHELSLDRIDALEGDQIKALKLAEIYRTGEFDGEDFLDIGIYPENDEALFWYKVAEFLGSPDPEGFDLVYDSATDLEYATASKRFEIWKKNLGFEYDLETLNDISQYYLMHRGTGFYINSDYLLTNKHVAHIDDNYNFKCDKITGYDPYSGKFEVYSNVKTEYLPKTEDIDLLKSPNPLNVNMTTLSSNEVFMGDEVVVIGFPKGKEVSKYPKMSTGIVNSEIGSDNNPNEFISDAVSYGGSSGSPVYSISGNLIGILWGGDSQLVKNEDGSYGVTADPNSTFAIKSKYIQDFLELNNVEYSISDSTEDLKLSTIAKSQRDKIRLLECYAHNDYFQIIN